MLVTWTNSNLMVSEMSKPLLTLNMLVITSSGAYPSFHRWAIIWQQILCKQHHQCNGLAQCHYLIFLFTILLMTNCLVLLQPYCHDRLGYVQWVSKRVVRWEGGWIPVSYIVWTILKIVIMVTYPTDQFACAIKECFLFTLNIVLQGKFMLN